MQAEGKTTRQKVPRAKRSATRKDALKQARDDVAPGTRVVRTTPLKISFEWGFVYPRATRGRYLLRQGKASRSDAPMAMP